MEKAVIYLRVSTDEQDEQSQLNACKKLCEDKGWEVVGIYKDHGKSAYKNVIRPKYDEICELIKAKKIHHVVVWALDRWTRKGPRELQNAFEFLSQNGVQLHSVHEKYLDNFNIPEPWGFVIRQTVIGLLGTMAEEESRLKSERVRTSVKFQKAVEKGTVGRQPISEEVKQKVIELLNEGKTWKEIREQVTYKGKYGKIRHISEPTISKIKNSLK